MSIDSLSNRFLWEKSAGLLFVLALHGALLYVAMSYKLIPPPQVAVTLFVSLINPPHPKKEEPPKPQQKVKVVKEVPVKHSQPAPMLVAKALVTSAAEVTVTPPLPIVELPLAAVAEAPPALPSAPVTLSSELSLACPDLSMPNYPAQSRRLNEHGKVVIHVELDVTGRITSAKVAESSSFKRLDEAGLTAVKSWHCKPAIRNGVAVRAFALQPFDFILEGN